MKAIFIRTGKLIITDLLFGRSVILSLSVKWDHMPFLMWLAAIFRPLTVFWGSVREARELQFELMPASINKLCPARFHPRTIPERHLNVLGSLVDSRRSLPTFVLYSNYCHSLKWDYVFYSAYLSLRLPEIIYFGRQRCLSDIFWRDRELVLMIKWLVLLEDVVIRIRLVWL